jgi:hypothetical protein
MGVEAELTDRDRAEIAKLLVEASLGDIRRMLRASGGEGPDADTLPEMEREVRAAVEARWLRAPEE